jgi:hypothetical protein
VYSTYGALRGEHWQFVLPFSQAKQLVERCLLGSANVAQTKYVLLLEKHFLFLVDCIIPYLLASPAAVGTAATFSCSSCHYWATCLVQ